MSNLVDHELDRLRRERDEARKQLGQVLYLTKAPSTQALVDGYLEVARLRGVAQEELRHWQALLAHYPDEETVDVTTASARRMVAMLTAALPPAPGPAGERQGG